MRSFHRWFSCCLAIAAALCEVAPVAAQEWEPVQNAAYEVETVTTNDIWPAQGYAPAQYGQGQLPGPYDQYPPGPPPNFVPNSPPASAPVIDENVWTGPRVWGGAELLYWWVKASPVSVPIVTTGSLGDTFPGAIGQPGTTVIIGNQDLSMPGRTGTRFTLGFALDNEQLWALEGNYFLLGSRSTGVSVFSDGFPGSATLAIPFFDPNRPGESATFLSLPGAFSGHGVLSLDNMFQGAELNLFRTVQAGNGLQIALLGGFRYFNAQENLSFTTSSPNVPPNVADVFRTFDEFDTRNNFYGGQIGARASFENNQIILNMTGKIAFGTMQERVIVNGATLTNSFSSDGSVLEFPGAYFSQPTNIGSRSVNQFAVIPEVNLNFGIKLSPWASVIVGYSFLYVSSVARPGDQIDRVINPTQAPAIGGIPGGALVGPARPALIVHDTDLWLQGLNLALELRF